MPNILNIIIMSKTTLQVGTNESLNMIGRICVINVGLIYIIQRILILQPYCDHIYYVDVIGKGDPEAVVTEKISFHCLLSGGLWRRYRFLKSFFKEAKPRLYYLPFYFWRFVRTGFAGGNLPGNRSCDG